MKTSTSFLLIALGVSTISCRNDSVTASGQNQPASPDTNFTSAQFSPGKVTKEVVHGANAQAPLSVAAPLQPTAPGMNPPHGQPGHDCAVAVGAPLNSPSDTNAVFQVPQLTASGMNPPHGQPGHDCTIPVGEPLKK